MTFVRFVRARVDAVVVLLWLWNVLERKYEVGCNSPDGKSVGIGNPDGNPVKGPLGNPRPGQLCDLTPSAVGYVGLT